MATVKAFIRTSKKKSKQVNIRFRLSDGEKTQLFYCSNFTIGPDDWDTKQQCIRSRSSIKQTDAIELNNNISNIKTIILKAYLDEPAKQLLTSTWLENIVNKKLYPERACSSYKAIIY